MTATLLIDQAGLPAGSSGFARTDGLDTGALVTVQSVGAATTATARLLTVPELDTTAASSFTQTSSSPPTWTFSPTANVDGMYRIELVTDNGLGSQDRQVRVFGIRDSNAFLFPSYGLAADPLANLGDLSDAQKAIEFIMANELNEVRAGYPSGYPFGYQAELDLILRTAAGGSATPPGTGALLWEWDPTQGVAQFEVTALSHGRDGSTVPAGGDADTALALTAHVYGQPYIHGGNPTGIVLRTTATGLDGGGVFLVLESELTLPERFVVLTQFGFQSNTALRGAMYPWVDGSTDKTTFEAYIVDRYLNTSNYTGSLITLGVFDLSPSNALGTTGSFDADVINTGGVQTMLTVHQRPAGAATAYARIESTEKGAGSAGNIQQAVPSDLSGVGTVWDNRNMDRLGIGCWTRSLSQSGTVDIARLRIYAHPDD